MLSQFILSWWQPNDDGLLVVEAADSDAALTIGVAYMLDEGHHAGNRDVTWGVAVTCAVPPKKGIPGIQFVA